MKKQNKNNIYKTQTVLHFARPSYLMLFCQNFGEHCGGDAEENAQGDIQNGDAY